MKDNFTVIDACGLQCPKPLILTKKQLSENTDPFIILLDDEVAKNNIQRFLSDKKIKYSLTSENNHYKLTVNSDSVSLSSNNALYKKNPVNSNIVICIKGLEMGYGPKELGEILLKAYINTIKEVNPLPSTIIFYNSAVKLTEKKSSVLPELKLLEEQGVTILVCGTCTNFFEITEKIETGTISNMYEIAEILSNADKVIYP